jgi:hypothetical protein
LLEAGLRVSVSAEADSGELCALSDERAFAVPDEARLVELLTGDELGPL